MAPCFLALRPTPSPGAALDAMLDICAGIYCAAATDLLELTEENVETVLDEVGLMAAEGANQQARCSTASCWQEESPPPPPHNHCSLNA